MVQFLGHLGIEARVRVLEDNVLPRVVEGVAVQFGRDAGLGLGLDVSPFLGGRAARGGLPFGFEGRVEGWVGQEGEQVGEFGVGFPGVLGGEDVGFEMVAEEVEAAAAEGGEYKSSSVCNMARSYSMCGCSGLLRLTFLPPLSPPLSSSRYPAIALLLSSLISLAFLSHTHA